HAPPVRGDRRRHCADVGPVPLRAEILGQGCDARVAQRVRCSRMDDRTIEQGPFEPTWESLRQYRCPEWFQDAKLGIWAHWGPQSVPMYGDWYARHMYVEGSDQYRYHLRKYGHPSQFGYKDVIALWKAERFEPEALMRLYVDAGARY